MPFAQIPSVAPRPGFIFIDANQYLTLYTVIKGKRLLDALIEQKDHIFVTAQIVDEVQRRKLQVASDFFEERFASLKLDKLNIPDHLFDPSTRTVRDLLEAVNPIAEKRGHIERLFKAAITENLERISRSIDEVSVKLDKLFKKAVKHSDEELKRARIRKERGNPPGKQSNPLGDQLNWEQTLTKFKTNQKVWLISQDEDFFLRPKCILNPFLYGELRAISDPPECFRFDDLKSGIADFARQSGIAATSLPTGKEAQDIEAEWAAASTGVSVAPSSSEEILNFFNRLREHGYRFGFGFGFGNQRGVFQLAPEGGSTPLTLRSDEEKPPKEGE